MPAPRPCYVSGSHIRAASGDVAIDTIRVGQDVVVIRDGRQCLESVKWIGHCRIDLSRHAYREQAAPIRLRKGCIGDNQPDRDLFVSPEHCLVIEGRCVPAKLLVNGGSIVSERNHEPFTYYHLELERHGILIAANTPAESYLDTGNRLMFDNAQDPRQLHHDFSGNFAAARWESDACAPLARVPDEIDPIWSRLAARSETIGYPIAVARTVETADIHICADNQLIQPVLDRDSRYVFVVPPRVASVTLMSRFCIPADKMVSSQRDTRRLGVSVNWIAIRSNGDETLIAADHPGLVNGWNDAEKDGVTIWRWTDGAATIPWRNVDGSAILTVRCSPIDRYPVYDEKARLVA